MAGQKKGTPYHNNPYNFIPLMERVYQRYDSMEQLPAHNTWAPEGISGVITCTFTAQTPVCVSDGTETNPDFFRQADGRYVLPGSTVKGLVRTNMQILGLGALRPGEDLDNVRMLYRAMASAKGSVKEPVKEDYQQVLECKNSSPKVCACYIRQEGDRYEIYPTTQPYHSIPRHIVPPENWAEYQRLCQEAEEKKEDGRLQPYEYTKIKQEQHLTVPNPLCALEWVDAYTKTFPVWYQTNGEQIKRLAKREEGAQKEGWQAGVLVATGHLSGQNTLYVFPAFDETEAHFQWPVQDQLAYEMDYKARKTTLGGSQRNMDPDFWALPKAGEVRPFFLLEDLSNGVVVGKTPYLRVAFQHTPGDGVPAAHRAAAEKLTLDYPYSVLGFSAEYTVGEERRHLAYRSRVSFEDFATSATPKRSVLLPGVNPKPTSFPDYLLDGKNYNQDDFRLRGIKQYWLQPPQTPDPREIKEKLGNQLPLMEEKSQFHGRIHFRNLARDELGLLLWCLTLDDGQEPDKCYYQTVGKGKPWGYGRMQVTLDAVEQLCPQQLYSVAGVTGGSYTQPLDAQGLIAGYCAHMERALGRKKPFRELSSIQDFLYMHTQERAHEEVRYLTLKEYANRKQGIPTVREEREAAKASAAAEDRDAEYRRRKAELGSDWKGLMKLIQEFQQRYPGWKQPSDA